MKNKLCFLVIGALLEVSAVAHAQGQAQSQAQAPAARPNETIAAGNVIANATKRLGIVRCANRIEQHERFFSQQSNPVSALSFVAPKDANNRLFSLSAEIVEQNDSVYVSSTYAPAGGKDECAASYDLVKYWPNPCQEVASKVYFQFGNPTTLARQITALGRDPNVKVFLMPAGEGCVSIKKEIVF
jgi:hypothetical protein